MLAARPQHQGVLTRNPENVPIHRVVQSKIVEDWALVESLGFFQQLELSRTRQTWWAISCVSKTMVYTRR